MSLIKYVCVAGQIANASLLDEATAAAEAMTMCSAAARGKKPVFLVSVRPASVCWGLGFGVYIAVPCLALRSAAARRPCSWCRCGPPLCPRV